MMNETYRGRNYHDNIVYYKKYLTLYRNQLLENVNYAEAVMGEPELFNLSNFDVGSNLQYYMKRYRIIISPFELISEDYVREMVGKFSNQDRVDDIKEHAQSKLYSSYNTIFVLNKTVASIFGMADFNERMYIAKGVLERGYYRENEYISSNKESYERKKLMDYNVDADLFVTGGGLSSTKLEVERSSCWFLNNNDDGYITFRTSTLNGLQRFGEVVIDCKFTGPCKLTLGGAFVVRNDNLLNGIRLQDKDWKISEDGICGINVYVNDRTGEKNIQCHYVQLLESGVYNLKEYYIDFEAHVRALLHEAGCMIKW